MKAAFVVALVLLCGCYAARLRSGKDFALRNKAPRDTTIVKIRLPCSYSFKYVQRYDDGGGEDGQLWRYDDNTHTVINWDGKAWYTYARNDIRQEGSPTQALHVSTIMGDDGSCSISDIYYDYPQNSFDTPSRLANIQQLECLELTQTTWNGKEALRCETLEWGNTVIYYIVDDLIVSFDNGSGTVNITDYTFKDFREKMALDKKCVHDQLPPEVYESPAKNSGCKAELQVVKLKVLPCSYGIKYRKEGYGTGWYERYGQNEMDRILYDDWTSNITYILRTDIHEPGVDESALYLMYYSDHDECEFGTDSYVVPGTVAISEFSEIFFSVYEKDLYCERLYKTTWLDKEYKCCRIPAFEMYGEPNKLYIKDELIVGMEGDFGNITFEYVFEDMRNDFALDTMCDFTYPGDIHAPPPEVENCDHKPKSRSAASSISVVASMILSMVMISLISLF